MSSIYIREINNDKLIILSDYWERSVVINIPLISQKCSVFEQRFLKVIKSHATNTIIWENVGIMNEKDIIFL